VHMIRLTERREITPYKWAHPEEEDRGGRGSVNGVARLHPDRPGA